MRGEKIQKNIGWFSLAANFMLVGVFVFLGLLFIAKPALAINQQITFQGKLTNTSGYNVANGTYYVKLTIYDAATSGSCQYSATSSCASVTSTPVTVTNGIFSVNLGDISASLAALPATLFNAPALYLGITVCSGPSTGCDSEMTPRKRLTSVPYAFNADYLGGVTTSTAGGNGSYIPATDSSGNLKISNSFYVATSTTGQVGVGTSTVPSGYKAYIESTTASDKMLVIRGQATQTGNLTEWQDSSGRTLGYFTTSTSSGVPFTQLDLSGLDSTRRGLLTIDNGAYLTQEQLFVGNGTASGTFNYSAIILNQKPGYNLGTFYVSDGDSSVSASGSLQIFQLGSFGGPLVGDAVLRVKATSTASQKLQSWLDNSGTTLASLASSTISLIFGDSSPQYDGVNGFVNLTVGNATGKGGFLTLQAGNTTNDTTDSVSALVLRNNLGVVRGQLGSYNDTAKLTLTTVNTTTTLDGANFIMNSRVKDYLLGTFNVDSSGNTSASGTFAVFGNSTLGNSDGAGGDTARIYGTLAMGTAPTGAAQLMIQATSTGDQFLQKWVDKNSKVVGSVASGTFSILASGTVYSDLSNLVNFTIGDAAGLGGYLNLQTSAVNSNIPDAGGFPEIGGLKILDSAGALRVGLGYVSALGGSLTLGGTSATTTIDTTTIMINRASGFNRGKFYVNSGNVSASGTLSVYNEIYSYGNIGLTLGIAAGRDKGLFNVDGSGNVSASGSLMTGTNNIYSGNVSFTFGDYNSNAGENSFVGGQFSTTTATAGWSMAMGQRAQATGTASFALGQNVQAAKDNAFVLGRGVFGGAALKNDIAQSLMIGFDSASPTMIVKNGGVGIATTTLVNGGTYKLLVDAGAAASAGIGVHGYIKATGAITQSTTLDLAEKYPIDPTCEAEGVCPEAGDVVMVKDSTGGEQSFYIRKAELSEQEKVIGIVSTQPGFVLEGGLSDLQSRNLTLAGRVPVKISTENGAIKVGDKLTVSATVPGAAMKYTGSGTIIGLALENYSSLALGKIVTYVSLSWDKDAGNPTNLNTQADSSGQLIQNDLNLNGQGILNIKSIVSSDNKWAIDENGWLVNNLKTGAGNKKVYGMSSENAELTLSGSGRLVNGEVRIEFETATKEIISSSTPLKVSVTLTAPASGVYVSEKGDWGFVVKELNSGVSGATFDWLVIARRKTQSEIDDTQSTTSVLPAEAGIHEPALSVNDPNTTSTTNVDTDTNIPPVMVEQPLIEEATSTL